MVKIGPSLEILRQLEALLGREPGHQLVVVGAEPLGHPECGQTGAIPAARQATLEAPMITEPTDDLFTMKAIPPFRLDLTVWALRRRATNQIDRWDGGSYRRSILIDSKPVEVAVTQIGSPDAARLRVNIGWAATPGSSRVIAKRALRRLLGLDRDLAPFYAAAAADPRLAIMANRFRGMKPPRFLSVFESLVNAIACQQISIEAGLALVNRFAARYGRAPAMLIEGAWTFPEPSDIKPSDIPSLQALGFSRQKSIAILDLVNSLIQHDIDLEGLAARDDRTVYQELTKLRGIGRWSADYVMLRGFGRIQVFPGDDVGARNNLQRWLGYGRPLDYGATARIVSRWSPYAGLVYMHLLLQRLADRGMIVSTHA